MDTIDFSQVTEVTGNRVTGEQLSRIYARYRFASDYCSGADVLETAFGSGQGLGLLLSSARRVVGVEYDAGLLKNAKDHYGSRVELIHGDAMDLPFSEEDFDVIILFEAIYYLSDPTEFVEDAYRILRKNGVIIICTANREWSDFNPSPHSFRYFSARELQGLLESSGFKDIELFGQCRSSAGSVKGRTVSLIKRAAVKMGVMPKTMKAKSLYKRIFFGRLVELPPELQEGVYTYDPPVTIPNDKPCTDYKVVFAVARKGG